MADPNYLIPVLVSVTLLVVGLLLIVDGIHESPGPKHVDTPRSG